MPTVETAQGVVLGVESEGVLSFKGIRYAAPPVNELRFAAPAPPVSWVGELDCREYGSISLQHIDPLSAAIPGCEWNFYYPGARQGEDCLNLNIWTPDPNASLPVMVWIHGGAFIAGSGTGLWNDGSILARKHNVVVVSINYRLGALGFLVVDDPLNESGRSGNNGLLDQVAALRWVQENIAAFGGDPSRVCIFGESAGAVSVMALLGTPGARGLFSRAIVQSGPHDVVRSAEQMQKVSEIYLSKIGAGGSAAIAKLRGIDTNKIMSAQLALAAEVTLPFTMYVDGYWLPRTPIDAISTGSATSVPMIVGLNSDESRLFKALGGPVEPIGSLQERVESLFTDANNSSSRAEMVDELLRQYSNVAQSENEMEELILDDRMWRAPVQEFIDACHRAGSTIFSYEFGYLSPVLGGELRACHVMEIPFVFGNLDQLGVNEFVGENVGEGTAAREISSLMCQAWASFADCGVPSGDGLPLWSAYSSSDHEQMYFSDSTVLRQDPHSDRTTWWTEHKGVMIPRWDLS